jgi:hypothetical protein
MERSGTLASLDCPSLPFQIPMHLPFAAMRSIDPTYAARQPVMEFRITVCAALLKCSRGIVRICFAN